jgi:alpha-1,2-mannosyltransferase
VFSVAAMSATQQALEALARGTGPVRLRGAGVYRLLAVFVALLAFVARLVPVLRGAGLQGILGYDDGVYYVGAASLLAGRWPYADFTLLHPPGILLVLAPFAALGRVTSDHIGLAAARLAFMALGSINAGMLTVVGSRLLPGRAALVPAAGAGLFYALWFSSIYATRTTLLEGLGTFGLVAALVLVWRRDGPVRPAALYCAGAALAFGACTKIWGLVPLLVVAGWVWSVQGRQAVGRLAAGAAFLAAAVCGPFLLAAPTQMPQLVVLDQLHRPPSTVSPLRRALDASSLHWNAPQLPRVTAVIVLVVLSLVLVAGCVMAWHAAAGLPVMLLAATAATLVISPSYFTHYGELVAAPLALVVAGAVAAGLGRKRRPRLGWVPIVLPLLALVLLELPTQTRAFGRPLDAHRLRAALSSARCVATDIPSTLAISDSLTRGLGVGCPVPVDLTGVLYGRFRQAAPDGRAMPRRQNSAWQAYLRTYLSSADAQVLVNPAKTLLDGSGVRALVRDNRLVARDGPVRVYRRR